MFQIICFVETKENVHQEWQYFSWSCNFKQYLHCRFCYKKIHAEPLHLFSAFVLLVVPLYLLITCLFLVLWSWLSSLQFTWETVKSFLKIDRKYQMNVSDLWRAAWAPAVWLLQAESSAPCHCGWEWSELLLQADFSNPSSKGIFSVKHWAAATVELVEFCYWRVTRTV